MFAWGNLERWIIFERANYETFAARDDCLMCIDAVIDKISDDDGAALNSRREAWFP
jgi:hypothetical protein